MQKMNNKYIKKEQKHLRENFPIYGTSIHYTLMLELPTNQIPKSIMFHSYYNFYFCISLPFLEKNSGSLLQPVQKLNPFIPAEIPEKSLHVPSDWVGCGHWCTLHSFHTNKSDWPPNDSQTIVHDWSLAMLFGRIDYLHGKWPMTDCYNLHWII